MPAVTPVYQDVHTLGMWVIIPIGLTNVLNFSIVLGLLHQHIKQNESFYVLRWKLGEGFWSGRSV
jgi:hypothetical protein